jgi:hypothetical protein
MRMDEPRKNCEIARLKQSHGCGEKSRREREGDHESAHVAEGFLRAKSLGPEASDDHQEI